MSFNITVKQVQNQIKTVTRRRADTWIDLRIGDLLQPVKKAMGLQKGEQQIPIGGPIRVINVRLERLDDAGPHEPRLEGFPEMSLENFIALEMRVNKCGPDELVRRIEFEYCKP